MRIKRFASVSVLAVALLACSCRTAAPAYVLVTGEVRMPGKIMLPASTASRLEVLTLAATPTLNASDDVLITHPAKAAKVLITKRGRL
jgi:hypothetical protein